MHPDLLAPGISDDLFEKVASTHGYKKPLALYLPGLDGVGFSAMAQFDDLSNAFEFWRMTISTSDRSSFATLTEAVSNFIEDAAVKLNRDVLLIGESFGGLLAPSVAMRATAQTKKRRGDDESNPIKGLVLVNPATSFDDTQWSTFAPLLSTLRHLEDDQDKKSAEPRQFPTPFSVLGGLSLAATIPDPTQFQRIVSMITDMPMTNTDDLTTVLSSMRDGFGILEDKLPPEVVEHRVGQWLPVGSAVVNPRLSTLGIPTFVIAGQEDNMLPTKKEVKRLQSIIPSCTVMEIEGSGHFVLDERVNLTEAIIDSDIDPLKKERKKFDPIEDWKPPSHEVIMETIEDRVKPLRSLTSPVFFSTGGDGSRKMGLSHLPDPEEGPIVFVANHQFGGLDLSLIIAQLLEERNIAARGLAHPVLFLQAGANGDGNPLRDGGGAPVPGGQAGDFQTFGAVRVSPRNYYRLMASGQTCLLFPGGVREVFHGKDEAHQLFWPDKVDFVRTAAKFNATVVPLSAVGAADSVNIIVDAPDIVKLPFGIGERAANASANVVSARFDMDNSGELFQPPFALPKPLPARHYFMFGKPMSTKTIHHNDREACERFYTDVKQEMQRGFEDILRARSKDPFSNTARRIAFEQITGRRAPTFPMTELH